MMPARRPSRRSSRSAPALGQDEQRQRVDLPLQPGADRVEAPVVRVKNGGRQLKDFPAELGGSGVGLPE